MASPFLLRLTTLFAAAALLATTSPALAQDTDGDTVPDTIDAFPCDATLSALSFAPAEGVHGSVLVEDHWPSQGDLDFNDLVLSHNIMLRLNASGSVVSIRAVFNALAIGGTFSNGLGWHLPIPRSAVGTVTRTVFGGATTTLTPAADSELTVVLSNDLRELFANQTGAINSIAGQAVRQGQVLIVDITLSSPRAVSMASAPWDVFIFRSSDPTHEIHRPEYSGTLLMNSGLFGTINDGSAANRRFVDTAGTPFVLTFPTVVNYPRELEPISGLFPNIVPFATSGGVSNQDFYAVNVNTSLRYASAPSPVLPAPPAVNRACIPTLSAQPDSVSVVQGQLLTIPMSTLLANDTAGSGGGTLTLTAVSGSFGGTAAISGTNVQFTPAVLAGWPAGFTYTMRNTLGHTAQADVTITILPLPAVQALMVDTQADLNALTASGSNYTPPSAQQIFNTWYRFSHGANSTDHAARGNVYPAQAADLQSWSYNAALDSVSSTANTPSYIGFISDEALDHFTFEVNLTATSASGDNDGIGVVIAFVTEGTPGMAGYREHTISAIRNRAPTEAHMRVAGVDTRWSLVQNYKQSDERILANGSSTAGGSGTWNSSATRTRVRVSRQGDTITVACSQYGSVTIDPATSLTIDLAQDPLLLRFRGTQRWGLSAHSQAYSSYQELAFTGGLNADTVYDVSVSPSRVWDFNQTSRVWGLRSSATAQSVLGCPRRVDRPAINTLSPPLGAQSFQLDCAGATRIQ